MRRVLVTAVLLVCIARSAFAYETCRANKHPMKRVTCDLYDDPDDYWVYVVGWLRLTQVSAHARYFNDSCTAAADHIHMDLDFNAPPFPKACEHESLMREYGIGQNIEPEWTTFLLWVPNDSSSSPMSEFLVGMAGVPVEVMGAVGRWMGNPIYNSARFVLMLTSATLEHPLFALLVCFFVGFVLMRESQESSEKKHN